MSKVSAARRRAPPPSRLRPGRTTPIGLVLRPSAASPAASASISAPSAAPPRSGAQGEEWEDEYEESFDRNRRAEARLSSFLLSHAAQEAVARVPPKAASAAQGGKVECEAASSCGGSAGGVDTAAATPNGSTALAHVSPAQPAAGASGVGGAQSGACPSGGPGGGPSGACDLAFTLRLCPTRVLIEPPGLAFPYSAATQVSVSHSTLVSPYVTPDLPHMSHPICPIRHSRFTPYVTPDLPRTSPKPFF